MIFPEFLLGLTSPSGHPTPRKRMNMSCSFIQKSKGTSLMQLHQRSLEVLLVRSVRWMYVTCPRAYVKNWTPRDVGVFWWGTRCLRHTG